MTAVYGPVFGMVTLIIAIAIVGNGPLGLAAGIIAGICGAAFWEYSPLPNHNNGFMSPADNGRYWGWNKPEDDQ